MHTTDIEVRRGSSNDGRAVSIRLVLLTDNYITVQCQSVGTELVELGEFRWKSASFHKADHARIASALTAHSLNIARLYVDLLR